MYQDLLQKKAERIGVYLTSEEANIVDAYLAIIGINPESYIKNFNALIQEALDKFIGNFYSKRDFGEWYVENSGYWSTAEEIVQVCVDYEAVSDYLYTGGAIDYQDEFYFWK